MTHKHGNHAQNTNPQSTHPRGTDQPDGSAAPSRDAAAAAPLAPPPLTGMPAARLLADLTELVGTGAPPTAAQLHQLCADLPLPAPPAVAFELAYEQLDPAQLAERDSFEQDCLAVAASALGPLLLPRLLPEVELDQLPQLLEALPTVPRQLPRVLLRIDRRFEELCQTAGPARLDRALCVVEQRLTALPAPLEETLTRTLGLPVAVGLLLDLRARCAERGAPLRGEPSPVQVLHLPLEALHCRSVFELLPAQAGSLDSASSPVSVDQLAQTATSLTLLGSYALALRLAVLGLLLSDTATQRTSLSELVVRLTIHRRSWVPPQLVPTVWALGAR